MFVGLPNRKGHFMFQYQSGTKFHKGLLQPSDHEVNLLCHHMRFNEEQIAAVMPKNTKYITILREPGELFASTFDYMHWVTPSFKDVAQTTEGLEKWLNNVEK